MEWPLDRPARLLLALPGDTDIPWAVFDAAWYRQAHGLEQGLSATALLDHYLTIGQAKGHSPNIFFDEPWQRAQHPWITAQIEAGHYESAFDAYCRRGCLDRSAHWLFDETGYRDRYQDLTDQVLADNGLANGYDHYLRHGVSENRVAHPLFDPRFYLAQFATADAAAIRQMGAFRHYLQHLLTHGPERRTSLFFDPAWYRQRYPDVAAAIAAGRWRSALHHYLCNDTPTAFDPNGSFSEAHYLLTHPGVRQAVAERQFRNGYLHFLRFGRQEGRSPSSLIDLAWYRRQPTVQADLDQGQAADAFAHWLAIGRDGGLPAMPAGAGLGPEQGVALAARRAEALLPVAGRLGYRFDQPETPAVSVVLVVQQEFATVMATIASLRACTGLPLELIIVDWNSEDETRAIGTYVPGAKILRLTGDTSWARSADAGRHLAVAPLLLFLSDACQLSYRAVDRARERITAQTGLAAVGGMVLQPDASILQAGGILCRDGSTHDYMHDESPTAPEANFVRQVDFSSADFLLVRTEVMSEVGGFDPLCTPGHEAIDLCLRVRQAGWQIVYDPCLITMLTKSTVRPASCPHIANKHADALQQQPPATVEPLHARHAGARPPRILFIEDTVPLRRIGSGFVRSNDIVRAIAELGLALTVLPVNGCSHSLAQVYADMPDTVEVMHSLALDGFSDFLQARRGFYDLIWVARVHNLQKVRPFLAQVHERDAAETPILLDTEALTPMREAQMAALTGRPFEAEPALVALLDLARSCTATIAVTADEAALLRQRGLNQVFTIGHAIAAQPTPRPFTQRAGLLFVGAIHTPDSPNLDSLHWFASSVLPLIEAELGWETRLTIVGHVAPGIDMSAFSQHPRITLRGALTDLQALYNSHRVFIAPTRYAAGAPYKVLEAASHGLPVACTEVLRRQIGWLQGQDIVAAGPSDPAALAAAILGLYRDETLWSTVRDGALRRVRQEHDWQGFTRSVAQALTAAVPSAALNI